METTATIFESLYEKGEAFSKTSYELARLKALQTTTVVVSSLLSRLAVVCTFALFVLVFNIGVALLIGDLLGKTYYGFFIVAAFYLVGGVVLHFFLLRWIKKPVTELIITQALQ